MLYRDLPDGSAIALSQLTHAWVAAELVSAWADPYPDEVVLGAMHHDIGWLVWEQAPTLAPGRGRPHDYRSVSTAEHVDIWSTAAPLALAYGRVPAWLTSRHGTRLYERHDYERDAEDEANAARAFVAREEARQRDLLAAITADPELGQRFSHAALEEASLLINGCDRLSLALCHGVHTATTLPDILLAGEQIALTLAPTANGVALNPWPFAAESWRVRVEGRVLTTPLQTDADVQAWLAHASWQTIELVLLPG